MKQDITKEQWDELSKKQKEKFCSVAYPFDDKLDVNVLPETIDMGACSPTIGTMIEFLGEKWWKAVIFPEGGISQSTLDCYLDSSRFCDSLWEAVKYKLQQNEDNRRQLQNTVVE